MNKEKILEVKNLKVSFKTDNAVIQAVNNISFSLHKGEILGFVGESGSGKSVSSLALLRLIDPPGKIQSGEILFHGRDILSLSTKEIRAIRGAKISMIFQNPMTSLNPFLRISTQLIETICLHQNINQKQALEKAIQILHLVGFPNPSRQIHYYAHQFSGGMKQRIMIAMALLCNPEILIADEPTTALDVTIQAQILELIKEISHTTGTSTILISHDLGVIAGLCDRVGVMYGGRIVEYGLVEDVFNRPQHPYTKGLLKAVPHMNISFKDALTTIPGQPPIVTETMKHCPFADRCDSVMDICRHKFPEEIQFNQEQKASCFLYTKKEETV